MKQVSVAHAKANLSALLDEAAAGEEITITRHGKPIARLGGIGPTAKEPWAPLTELRRRLPPWPMPSVDILRDQREDDDARVDRALGDWREAKR